MLVKINSTTYLSEITLVQVEDDHFIVDGEHLGNLEDLSKIIEAFDLTEIGSGLYAKEIKRIDITGETKAVIKLAPADITVNVSSSNLRYSLDKLVEDINDEAI